MSDNQRFPLVQRLATGQYQWNPPLEGREPEVEAALIAAWASARSEWPGVELSDEEFIASVAPHLPTDQDPLTSLPQLRLAELYLCSACAHGIPGAVEVFEERYMKSVRLALSRIRLSVDAREELTQKLRVRLLTGNTEQPPTVTSYSGRGSLSGWLKVTASRSALMLLRHESVKQKYAASEFVRRFDDADDPELREVKRLYREQFVDAMTRAFEELNSEQRALLRDSMVPGRTMEALAHDFGVNKSTVSRWLKSIRTQIYDGTRKQLRDAHGIRESDCLSLMRIVHSGLHVSLDRLLHSRSDQ